MNKYIFIVILLLNSFLLSAQINENGRPFIKNYSPEEYGAAGQTWAIVKDNRGVMYFGNNFGLLEYNGSKWKLKYNPNFSTTILSLAKDNYGTLYFGAIGQFGMMIPDSTGELEFFSLSNFINQDNSDAAIRGIHTVGDRVIFRSSNKIFSFKTPIDITNLEKVKNEMLSIEPENAFHISFDIYDKFYVRDKGKGLKVLKNNKLELIPGGEQFANNKIYVMLPYDGEKILIVTREEGFYLFDPNEETASIVPFKNETSDLVQASYSYGGVALSNERFAISTLANGVIVFNKDGRILEQINEKSGLPDQMVLSIYIDESKEGNLWFTTNESGIFSVDINSPFRKWDRETGLEGVVADIIRFKDTVYVATSNGVFYSEINEDGFEHFKALDDISFESWDFLNFETENDSILLLGSSNGVFEISNKEAKLIEPKGYILKLHQSSINPEKLFVGFADGIGVFKYNGKEEAWSFLGKNDSINNAIKDIYENNNDGVYLGTDASGFILLDSIFDNNPTTIDSTQELPLLSNDYKIINIDNEIVLTSGKGLFVYNKEKNQALPYTKFGDNLSQKTLGVSLINYDNEAYWLGVFTNDLNKSKWQGVIKVIKTETGEYEQQKAFGGILPEKAPLAIYQDGNFTWIANEKGLYKYDKTDTKNYQTKFNAFVTFVYTKNDSILFNGSYKQNSDSNIFVSLTQSPLQIPILKFKYNEITFEYSSGFYEFEEKTEYSYRLIGYNDKWSKWTTETKFPYTNLYEGDYIFEVKAKNIYGTESNVASYKFEILSPWYRTLWAYILYVVAAGAFVWLMVVINTRRLKRDKEHLEQVVTERTKEIRLKNVELEQQKEEIQAQRDEIEQQRDYVILQKDEITKQHDKIAEQQKNIMASIQYASRIQEAVLPPGELLDELLAEHFVLFKPRDIVSGDFYWATRKDNKAIIVAADCTGHGVPGAFMSMLGVSFLNEIVNKLDVMHSDLILNELRENVKKSLRQTGKDNEAKDGMDIALCIIDYDKMQLEYSGAFNSLFLIREGELIKYDADRMPIGIYIKEKESFTSHIVDLKKGDNFYIFSDGYVDQFGGNRGSKLMVKRFKQLLLDNHQKPALEQKAALESFLEEWQAHTDEKGETYKQIDDILVIGMKV